MTYGYIRVSTLEQHTDRQDVALSFCDKIYSEKISGKNRERPMLKELLSVVREGDTVYITEMSRLARNNIDLCTIAKELMEKGVALKSLKENIDLSTATGVFTFQIFSAMAEFERSLIKERQAEGIAAAKASGKSWGAKKKYDYSSEEIEKYILMFRNADITAKQAIEELGITRDVWNNNYRAWKKAHGCSTEKSK